MDKILELIEEEFAKFKENAVKAGKGNKSAGVRARGNSLMLRNLLTQWKQVSTQSV